MTTLAVVAGIFITGVLSMFGMIYMMLQMILLNLDTIPRKVSNSKL